jgi:hypothetical protein
LRSILHAILLTYWECDREGKFNSEIDCDAITEKEGKRVTEGKNSIVVLLL